MSALSLEGAAHWPLPLGLSKLITNPEIVRSLGLSDFPPLIDEINLPKALMPCVLDGASFLSMKHLEHRQLIGLAGEIFVAPAGRTKAFAKELALTWSQFGEASFTTQFLEQGPSLSTIRFYRDGRPVIEANGKPSIVPAGHGAITKLFPEVKKLFPKADTLFLRNIDNVMGTKDLAVKATADFLAMHRELLTAVISIRTALAEGRLIDGAKVARATMQRFLPQGRESWSDISIASPELPLRSMLTDLFHTPTSEDTNLERLRELYARPVNLLGQVPNIHNDVGGTPCFVKSPGYGEQLKISLELPHASAEDRERFLANAKIATHFNPGFCALEITDDSDYYHKRNEHFWILAEKTYRGEPVVYYETVIYELVGNSELANTVFVEVPRLVFNPHKALKDALNQRLKDWLST